MTGKPWPNDIDLLVVGGGIAGLFASITAAETGQRVLLLTKSALAESNTRYAQGGIAAAVGQDDSPELHAADTLRCGGEINDSAAVDTLTVEARECLEQLISLGIGFDCHHDVLALTREAAHTVPRVVHAGGDATGRSIVSGLAEAVRRCGVVVIENACVAELVKEGGRITGVEVLNGAGVASVISASRVLLATGGAGVLYSRTTNPGVATGDGLTLAYRAGAELMDLEFFQFHPTAAAITGKSAFLISEAARGEGAVLRNQAGRRFAFDYHSDGELAPRDVVARAIWSEMAREHSKSVFLDLTHLSRRHLQNRFPTIWQFCHEAGLDVSCTPIPVAPAAHYFMGGIRTDVNGATSLPGLFAAGEVACTAVHGANRLASNSLLEGLVFGRRAAMRSELRVQSSEVDVQRSTFNVQCAALISESSPDGQAVADSATQKPGWGRRLSRLRLQELNWRCLGLIRDASGLHEALALIGGNDPGESAASAARIEDDNLRLVSRLMAQAALLRTESRGAHFRTDFPAAEDGWRGHIVADRSGFSFQPITEFDAGIPNIEAGPPAHPASHPSWTGGVGSRTPDSVSHPPERRPKREDPVAA